MNVTNTKGMDIESFINSVTANFAQGSLEDKKAIENKVKVDTKKVKEKRQEKIDNLLDQMKKVSHKSEGCFKVIKVVFKMIDFIMKPLSLMSMGKVNVELSKTLDMLQEAKKQGKILGLKIDGESIMKALDDLKKFLQQDYDNLKTTQVREGKEMQKMMRILDEIHETYQHVTVH